MQEARERESQESKECLKSVQILIKWLCNQLLPKPNEITKMQTAIRLRFLGIRLISRLVFEPFRVNFYRVVWEKPILTHFLHFLVSYRLSNIVVFLLNLKIIKKN